MYPLQLQHKHFIVSFLGMLIFSALTLILSTPPELFHFSATAGLNLSKEIMSSPLHLSDDVMISLRAGNIFNETGIPAFNRTDIAQPSTSYLSPYLFAIISRIFSSNISVFVYAGLGFLAVALTFFIIIYSAKSRLNGLILVTALTVSTTNTGFALNGWDHLFQGLFLSLAAAITLASAQKMPVILALCLSFGSLFRPDGAIIATSILVSLFLSRKNDFKFTAYVSFQFIALILVVLFINYMQFGHLTPTTARLKLGAAPSLQYQFSYLIKNGLLTCSAITITTLICLFYFKFHKLLDSRRSLPIVIGCAITALIAAINSDAFVGGRMFWAPAVVLCTTIGICTPSLVQFSSVHFKSSVYLTEDFAAYNRAGFYFKCCFAFIVLLLAISGGAFLLQTQRSNSVISWRNFHNSPTAQQFRVAKWIDENLNPKDGAIGMYYLGVGFHIPRFELADFLGKADETIANSGLKWGPPGHNKWDTDKTLNKWPLQAIIPPRNGDYTIPENLEKAKIELDKKSDYGFGPDLIVNNRVQDRFAYCYIRSKLNEPNDTLGFYLKKELVGANQASLTCFTK